MNKFLLAILLATSIANAKIQDADVKSAQDLKTAVKTITGNLSSGNACIASPSSLTSLAVGQYLYDLTTSANIPSGTTIAGLPGTCSAGQIQMSANAAGTATGDSIGVGAPLTQLINDTKLWVSSVTPAQPLSTAITAGLIGGGGGNTGKNYLANASFEGGTSSWTISGATSAVNTSDFHDGSQSITLTPTGAGSILQSVTPTTNLKGSNIEAGLWVKTTKTDVQNCSYINAVEVECQNVAATGEWIYVPANSAGPAQGTSIGVKLKWGSTGGSIIVDMGYVGGATNLTKVAQAYLVGTAKVMGCSTYWSSSTNSLVSLGTQTGCTYSVTGSAIAPATNVAGFKFASLPAGEYKIEYEGFWGMTASNDGQLQFTDGTTTAREISTMSGVTGQVNSISQSFTYTTAQSNVTWQLFGSAGSGSLLVGGTNSYPGVFRLYYYPNQSQLAVNSLQADFGWTDGGVVTIEATTTNPTKGTVNTDKFWYKKSGDSGEFRIEYSQTTGGSAGSGDYIFKLPNGLQFDLTKVTAYSTVVGNNAVQAAKNAVGSCMASSLTYPTNLVGVAVVYDATHVRCLGTDITTNGAIHSGFYQITDNASYAFSFKAPISGWNNTQNAPILVGSVTSGSSNALRIEYAKVSAAGVVSGESSDWINGNASLSDTSLYDFTLNGVFSAVPTCWGHGTDTGGFAAFLTINPTTSNLITVRTGNHLPSVSQQKVATEFNLTCIGTK